MSILDDYYKAKKKREEEEKRGIAPSSFSPLDDFARYQSYISTGSAALSDFVSSSREEQELSEEELLTQMTPTQRMYHQKVGGFVDTSKSWSEQVSAVSQKILKGEDTDYAETDKLLKQLQEQQRTLKMNEPIYEGKNAELQGYYNQLFYAKNKDILSKTKMDGTGRSILQEMAEVEKLEGDEKKKRKEAVMAKMEELGISSKDYVIYSGGSNFTWESFGKWLGHSVESGLGQWNYGLAATANATIGKLLDGLGWEDNILDKTEEYYSGLLADDKFNQKFYSDRMGGGAGWDFANDAATGTVGAIPDMLLTLFTMGANKEADLAAKAAYETGNLLTKAGLKVTSMLKNPSYWMSFVRTYGTDYNEAKERGASDSVAVMGATLSSMINAGIEIGFDGGSGIQGLPDDLLDGNKNKFWSWIESSLEEGGEEGLQKFVTETITKLFYDHDANVYNPLEYAREMGIGTISGMALGGGQTAIGAGMNAYAEYQANKLTGDETTVVDKVYEELLKDAEKNGKLSAAEKSKLRKKVISDMKKGYITAEKVEEILGGDAYKNYRTEVENFANSDTYKTYKETKAAEEKIQKEFDDLKGKTSYTLEEMAHFNDLLQQVKEMKKTSKVSELKSQLDAEAARIMGLRDQMRGEVMNRVKGSRLAESYSEMARRNEAFTADLNKYTDENAKKTVENIMKISADTHANMKKGVGDNTKQFHEFVDFLARISADKGVAFDMTNDELLKETEHYREGYITNGFVSDDGKITINWDSPKALNTIVGHEITHTLEKSGAFGSLRDALFDYAISKEGKEAFNKRIKDAEEAYKGMKNTTPEAEVAADLIGEYLFTDADFVQHLSKTNHKGFMKMFDDIKYLCRVVTAGSKEAAQLEKVKREFQKAYNENIKGKPVTGTHYSFAGINSNTADTHMLAEAEEMLANGEDSETIRKETGWFKGYDGKWRYEVNDSEMEILKNLTSGRFNAYMDGEPLRLDDIIQHEALFEAYPQLRDTTVQLKRTMGKGIVGAYNADTDTLSVSGSIYLTDEMFKEMLIHEIQHTIQNVEGFARGSSPKYWETKGIGEAEYEAFVANSEREKAKILKGLTSEERQDYLRYVETDRLIQEALKRVDTEAIMRGDDSDSMDALNDVEEIEAENDALYNKLYSAEWFNKLQEIDNVLSDGITENLYTVFYKNTAGEIEARDVTNRVNYSDEQRVDTRPDIDKANVTFAQSGDSLTYIGETKDGRRCYQSSFDSSVPMDERVEAFKKRIATIFNLGAVELKTDVKKIRVKGDKITAKKNLHGDLMGQDLEKDAKVNALYDLADILATAKYDPSAKAIEQSFANPAIPPKNKAHKGVKYWYKFRNEIVFDGVPFTVTFNIRDKGTEQYQYLIDFKENKTPGLNNTAVKSLVPADQVSYTDNISQNEPDVKYSVSKESIEDTIWSIYNYDTAKKPSGDHLDRTVVDFNIEEFIKQAEKGHYHSIVESIVKHTGRTRQEVWNAFSKFLMQKEGIAKVDGKTYVNVHELSEENLREAFDLGGLAAPSIGIVDVDAPTTNFGRISLIFPDIFNPETNPTFYGDSYSSSFPATAKFTNRTTIEDALTYGFDGMEYAGILTQEEISELLQELEQMYIYNANQRTSHTISEYGFRDAEEFARNWSVKSISGLHKLYQGLDGQFDSYEDFLEDFAEKVFTEKRIHKDNRANSLYDFDERAYNFMDYTLDNAVEEMTASGEKDFNFASGERVAGYDELLSDGMRARLKDGSTRFYEVKPQRSVYIDEATYAVVPEDTSSDVIEMLEAEGVKVVKYQGFDGVDDGKAEAIKGILENDTTGVRYSMSKETDNDYMYAITNGDSESVERFVEEAANLAMPDSEIRDKSGRLVPVYHGTKEMFWEFDTSKKGGINGTAEGFGIYLSDDPEVTSSYGDRQIKMYANITKPATSTEKTISAKTLAKLIEDTCKREAQRMVDDGEYDNVDDAIRDTWISNYVYTYDMTMEQAYREVAQTFLQQNSSDMDIVQEVMFGMAIRSYDKAMDFYRTSLTPITGFDGFATHWETAGGKKSNIYLAFDSSQLKSADPVSYDDSGNIIPLSERFNAEEKDIRYSMSKEGEDLPIRGNYNVYSNEFGEKTDALDEFDIPIREEQTTAPTSAETDANPFMDDEEYLEQVNSITDEDAPPERPKARPTEDSRMDSIDAKISEKHKALVTELEENQRLQAESRTHFDEEIAELQAEYDAKKNKNTATANDILRRIERLKRMRDSVDADYTKRIERLGERIDKVSKKEYSTAEHRRAKMQEHNDFWESLLGDTSTWKDLPMGIMYKTKTMRRFLRKVVRGADGKPDIAKADAIYDALETKYDHHEAQLKRESGELKEVFKKLNLNHHEDTYAHMLGELRHNPQTTLTEDVVNEYYNKHKKSIDAHKVDYAIKESRKLFDDLIVRVNKVLREQGFKEIPYRQGYFPHFENPKQNWLMKLFNWKPVNNDIPTDIAGLTETFNPQRSWQGFDKQRKSDTTDYSLYQGLDTYIHGALDWIYHIDDLQSRRALENYIRYVHSDEGVKARIEEIKANDSYDADQTQEMIEAVLAEAKNPLNNLVTELRARTNTLANKKSSMDRGMEEATNRKVYSTMTNLNNRINANMVVGSLSSALTNFIPMVQSWHQVSPVNTVRGLFGTIKSSIRDDGMVENSDFLTNRLIEEEKLYKTGWDKASDKAAFMMNIIDNITSQTVWRSKYLQNMDEGMSYAEAVMDADQFAKNLMAGWSRGNAPSIFDAKNPLIKIFTSFQLEVANQYGYMFEDVPQDSKNTGRLIKGYATAFLGAYVYNALYSSLVGRDAAFDPIAIFEDLFRDMGLFGDDDDEEKEPEDIALNLVDNILEEVPYVGSLVGGGRIPMSSAMPYDGDYKTFVADIANGEVKVKEMLKPLYYLALPFGGGQLKKTNEGLAMFDDDLPVTGSYTGSGALRYPVEDTFGNRLQAGLFGQYANKNARDYFDNGRTPLQEKQIQEYKDLDIPIRDYWGIRDGLKDKGTLGEKLAYIGDLDLPIRKQNILANNAADRDEPIDMADWDKYDGLEEFDYAKKYPEKEKFLEANGISVKEFNKFDDETKDAYNWAYQNPEKYAVSKAVTDDLVEYKKYTKALNDIRADKDANGKAIAGSAKNKKVEYINGLNLDYGAKLILFKSEYPSDDTYNNDIIDYLNNNSKYTFEDKKTILTELGFTVLDDGTVRWN